MAHNLEEVQFRAEKYAEHKADKFLKNFMDDTRLTEMLPMIVQFFRDDALRKQLNGANHLPVSIEEKDVLGSYGLEFGKWLAMSYALGFCDGQENRKERRSRKRLAVVPPPETPDIA